MRHLRPRPRWKSYAIIAAWFVGLTLGAYFIIQADPFWAAVAFFAAAAAISYNLYIEDRNRRL